MQVAFTQKDEANIELYLRKTYDSLKGNTEGLLDVTYLKYLLHKVNLHVYNPALFKAINDRSKNSDFKEAWSQDDFVGFFMDKPMPVDR